MTLDGTNTWIIDGRVVVDPGPLDEDHLRAIGAVDMVVRTHNHVDHVEGIPRLLEMTGAHEPAAEKAEVEGLTMIPSPGHTRDSVSFLIEGHTDKVGSDVDNLSLSDRRAESAATLLTQQFNVPAENLTSQGYGEQYPKDPTDGPSAINRRVTVRRITPLLNGGQASLPPPPPGIAPPR